MNCIQAPASRHPEGRLAWTLDYCANIVFGKVVIRSSHAGLFEGGRIPHHIKVGYAYPLSINPCRAVFWSSPEGNNDDGGERDVFEVCRFHIGQYAILSGKKTVVFCSSRTGIRFPRNVSICLSFVLKNLTHGSWFLNNRTISPMRRGYLYHLGAYETPAIYESFLGARKIYCEGIE